MSFPFNVYLLAFAAAVCTSALTLPLWRRVCIRTGLVDDPGHRKIHHQTIPLAGGLAVLTGLVIPVFVGALALAMKVYTAESAQPIAYGLGRRALPLAAIILGALGMVMLGLLDDKHELRASVKFVGQLLIAMIVAAAGVRITLFVPNVMFSYAITILWILTVINAFNFMDNMNGLCAGLGAIGAWQFGLLAAAAGQYLVASTAFLICGALAGYLPWNFPKARAFLGDSGSHLVGYLLAVLAILPHFHTPEHPRRLAVLTPLLVLALPLADLLWVVLLRTKMGKPFYIGDTNHLSHQLVRRGLSHTTAVLLLWLAMAITGGLALL